MPNFGFKLPGGTKADVADTPTDGQVLTFDSAADFWDAQDAGGGTGGFDTVFKTADETIQLDTTLTDDTDLQFAIAANDVTAVITVIFLESNAAANWKDNYSGPAGCTGRKMTVNGLWRVATQTTNPFDTGSASIASNGTEQTYANYMKITNGATAGTLAFQWAQQSSQAIDTILKLGSFMMFRKMN